MSPSTSTSAPPMASPPPDHHLAVSQLLHDPLAHAVVDAAASQHNLGVLPQLLGWDRGPTAPWIELGEVGVQPIQSLVGMTAYLA